MKTSRHRPLNPASPRALAIDRDRKRQERRARREAGLVEIRLLVTRDQRDRLYAVMDRASLSDLRSPKKILASNQSTPALAGPAPAAAVKPKTLWKRADASPAQTGAAQKPVGKAPAIIGVQLDLFPI
jgi:hypothetical protein